MMKADSGRRGIIIVTIAAFIAVAAIVGIMAMSYDAPAPSSPAEFGDPTPQIQLIYNGEMYEGELLGAVFGEEPISELPSVNQKNITSISVDAIDLKEDSTFRVSVTASSSLSAEPYSLSVNAYTDSGNPVGVLATRQESGSYAVKLELPQGSYVLLTTATWIAHPERQALGGYVAYGYRITVE